MPAPPPRIVLAVAVGGALGTLARHALTLALDPMASLPWGTLLANLLGSLLLGVVVAVVVSPLWRAAVGTGVLGGFTTYSAFAVQTSELAADRPAMALGYALATVVGGWALALLGITVGRKARR